jgi:hypothetical protein
MVEVPGTSTSSAEEGKKCSGCADVVLPGAVLQRGNECSNL